MLSMILVLWDLSNCNYVCVFYQVCHSFISVYIANIGSVYSYLRVHVRCNLLSMYPRYCIRLVMHTLHSVPSSCTLCIILVHTQSQVCTITAPY